jgi:fused signal recognition particle receptor
MAICFFVMEKTEKKSLFARLREGLKKTNSSLAEKIARVTAGRAKIDDGLLDELEELLITADVGLPTTMKLVDSLRSAAKAREISSVDEVRPWIRKKIEEFVTVAPDEREHGKPHVILIIGVNGSGKTTSIAKLAKFHKADGKEVLLAAADTFRAAATEQLAEWSRRLGCDIVAHRPNSDPSAVVFDALKAGAARGKDIVIVDTAGRLHTRVNLMEQLKKVRRIIAREIEAAPHETLLVLDGTTGQNCVNQVKEFNAAMPVTGLILTKLDGTSKGGAIIGIVRETGIPVKFIGIGEGIDDFQRFDPEMFAEAIL